MARRRHGGLSQGLMDQVGRIAVAVFGAGVEAMIYHAKANAAATAVDYELDDALFEDYSEKLIAMQQPISDKPLVQRGDQQLRLRTAVVTWQPTRYDEVTRDDGTVWRVLDFTYGRHRPWWLLHVRRKI